MTRPILTACAAATSSIGIAMSVASAMDRAATPADQLMFAAIGATITAAAHTLPALTRGVPGRLLWSACLAVTMYGHAGYFASAIERAGQHRAESVQQDGATLALRDQLQSITARPTATVAGDLGAAQRAAAAASTAARTCTRPCSTLEGRAKAAQARVNALQTEIDEAHRADELRTQLTARAEQHDLRQREAAADPAARVLSAISGLSPETLQASVQLISAALVELLAALLWSLAIGQRQADSAEPAPKTKPTPPAARRTPAPLWSLVKTAGRALRSRVRDSPARA